MKLDRVQNSVKTSTESQKLNIKIDSKIFELLIANYSNPIKAFVRELSTNAYEAHQILNKEKVPFDIYLPTTTDTEFTIRDYGPGLSVDDVEKIYKNVGTSSKDDNNELGGCFGVGSKAPYAYVQNAPFSVTSFYEGKKYIYTLYLDEEGFPCMDLMQTVDTDEPSGVEVTVPIRRVDIENVHSNAETVFSWFLTVPNIVRANRPLNIKDMRNLGKVVEGPGFTINNTGVHVVVMGNIPYPINYSILGKSAVTHGIIITAPIGSVRPDLSREQLKYNARTNDYLRDRLEDVENFLSNQIQDEIDKCKNFYEACQKAMQLTGALIGFSHSKYTFKGRKIESVNLTLTNAKCYRCSFNKVKYNIEQDFNYLHSTHMFCVDSFYHKKKIDIYLNSYQHYNSVVIVKKKHLADTAKEIGVDESSFVLTSSIPYTPPAKSSTISGLGHKTKLLKWKGSAASPLYAWDDSEIDVHQQDGYYVEYYRNNFKHNNGEYVPRELLHIIEIMGIKSDNIYGIKSELLKKTKDTGKLKNLIEEFTKYCAANEQKLIEKIKNKTEYAELGYRTSHIKMFSLLKSKHNMVLPSDLDEVITFYDSYKQEKELCQLKRTLVKTLTSIDLISASVNNSKKRLGVIDKYINKYPLLNKLYCPSDVVTEIKYYLIGKGW